MQERIQSAALDAGYTVAGMFEEYVGAGVRPAIQPELRDQDGVAFVNFDHDAVAAGQTVAALQSIGDPRIVCIGVGSTQNYDAVLYALRSGCNDFISTDTDHTSLVGQITKVVAQLRPVQETRGRNGRLILCAGVRGGVGTTSVAVHLALKLADLDDKRTLLVDHAPELGHVGLYLNQDSIQYSYASCAQNVEKLDPAMLKGYVRSCEEIGVPPLDLLLSPDTCYLAGRDREPSRIGTEKTQRIIHVLRHEYDFVVFDTRLAHPEFSDLLDAADMVLLVVNPDIGCARDLRRRLESLNMKTVNDAKLKLILNRNSSGLRNGATAVTEAANIPLLATVPDIYEEMCNAANVGFPLPQEVKQFHTPLDEVAAVIHGGITSSGPKKVSKQKSWFSRKGK
jgi:pilus assembly protein CpaE